MGDFMEKEILKKKTKKIKINGKKFKVTVTKERMVGPVKVKTKTEEIKPKPKRGRVYGDPGVFDLEF